MGDTIKRYFSSLRLGAEDELDEVTALQRGLYHLAYYQDDELLYIENVRGSRTGAVIYHRPEWRRQAEEEAGLYATHLERHGNISYSVLRRWAGDEGTTMEEQLWYSAYGLHTQSRLTTSDANGQVRRAEFFDADGTLAEIIEYDYDDAGQRLRERHYSPSGVFLFTKE